MKFLRSWLEDYIDVSDYSDAQISEAITNYSSEVEEVKQITDYFECRVVVGKIKNVRAHPNADRLKVFDVVVSPDGSKSLQIVSAAPNVVEGLYVPVALEGAVLADMTIARRLMRGVESVGMCCGKSELLLETEFSAGLWEIYAEDNQLGQSICAFAPELFAPQTVFDIKILPDKYANLANYLGMAIELAICLRNLDLLSPFARHIYDTGAPQLEGELSESELDISFEDTTGYTNQFHILDLALERPFILDKTIKLRLFLTQIHLISNIGDLSNYLMYDIGQPSHFFATQKIVARAQTNQIRWRVEQLDKPELFAGLGQLKNTVLPVGTVVMRDEREILTLIGISGGDATKVDTEEHVIIELPHFDREKLSRNSFLVKYRTDGSKLWSGGAPAARILVYLSRLRYVLDLHDQTSTAIKSVYRFMTQQISTEPVSIPVDFEYIASRLDGRSVEYWVPKLTPLLSLFGIFDTHTQLLSITNISYSSVCDRETLLAALFNILGDAELVPQKISAAFGEAGQSNFETRMRLGELVRTFGFDQVIARPFVSQQEILANDLQTAITVLKPQNQELDRLRTTVLSTLGPMLGENLRNGIKKPRIFEQNSIYVRNNNSINDHQELCVLYAEPDPYLATSLVSTLLEWTGSAVLQTHTTTNQYGVVTSYSAPGIVLEVIQINNSTKKSWGISLTKSLWAVCVKFDDTLRLKDPLIYHDTPQFPAIERTFSLSVPQDLALKTVMCVINEFDGVVPLVYPIERLIIDSHAVLNLSLVFQSSDHTMTGEQISTFEEYLLAELSHRTGSIVSFR